MAQPNTKVIDENAKRMKDLYEEGLVAGAAAERNRAVEITRKHLLTDQSGEAEIEAEIEKIAKKIEVLETEKEQVLHYSQTMQEVAYG